MRSLYLFVLLFFSTFSNAQVFSILSDINPGAGSSEPSSITKVGNLTYFLASPDGIVKELYVTDGTVGGTKQLTFSQSSYPPPNSLFGFNGKLYFFGYSPNYGSEPWISDGTVEGTKIIKDIRPGNTGSGANVNFQELGGVLYFTAAGSNSSGDELWRTDGTEAGTYLAADINDRGSSAPYFKVKLGNLLIFPAQTPDYGEELYRTDGTAAGTYLLKDILPGSGHSQISYIVTLNGSAYVLALNGGASGGKQQLWKTDGTILGTTLVKDFSLISSNTVGQLYVAGNYIYFAFDDGVHGSELWKTDGTSEGTLLVKDISSELFSTIYSITPFNNILYFSATDGINGYELWRSDGTEVGTYMVKNIHPTSNSFPQHIFPVGNQIVFSATTPEGIAIHKSDGTTAGTLIVELVNGSVNTINSSENFVLARINTTAYGPELWSGSISSVLPLSVLDFTATRRNQYIQLSWITTQERNVKEFFIERSNDSREFGVIGSLPFKSGNAIRNHFTYMDNNANNSGTYFYRLRILDKDGNQSFSKIASIRILPIKEISISPNPSFSSSIISLEATEKQRVTIRITNNFGKVLDQQIIDVLKGSNFHQVDMSKFSSGIYNVEIISNYYKKVMPVVKL
jgi:ELWxxDGT repeat protein